MAKNNRWWTLLTLVLCAAVLSCADGDIDDPDGSNSVLEILTLENNPVTCEVVNGFCQGDASTSCDTSAGCVINQVDLGPCIITLDLQVQDWTGTAANVPRTTLATTSPFNDITLDSVLISYDWGVGSGCVTPPGSAGLAATIPADSTATFTFGPIEFDAVGDLCLPGNTADLTLTFFGHTPSESLSTTVTRELSVESCN